MNITQLAKLRAEFLQGQRYTQHVHDTSRPGQRAVRQIERWEREKGFLGQGAYGTVYLEKCIYSDIGSTGKARAVKVIKKSKEVQYERELEAVILFSHEKVGSESPPNEMICWCWVQYRRCFVESFGWYDTPKEIFIAMEYLPHGDLQQYLASQDAQIPESEVKAIVPQLLEGLQYMHDLSITHRDIKPKVHWYTPVDRNVVLADQTDRTSW
jgi:serine/threonine protein kinase